jgi:hypothetical protein
MASLTRSYRGGVSDGKVSTKVDDVPRSKRAPRLPENRQDPVDKSDRSHSHETSGWFIPRPANARQLNGCPQIPDPIETLSAYRF